MLWYEWIPIILGSLGIITAILAAVRFFVKYHVKEGMDDIRHELKPNGGTSIKDQVTRLETKQIEIIERQQVEDERFDKRLDKLETKIDDVMKLIIQKLGN